MSSHPGSTMNDAVEMALWLKKWGYSPEQVQDFYPTPGTVSTVMYYTGINPLTMKRVPVTTDYREKQMQRALLQFKKPENAALVREALRAAGRDELIGYGEECLIRPAFRENCNNRHTARNSDGKKRVIAKTRPKTAKSNARQGKNAKKPSCESNKGKKSFGAGADRRNFSKKPNRK